MTLHLDRLSIDSPDGAPLLRDVTLHVPPGGCVCVIGETGSGKTLIAQAMLGLLPPGMRVTGTLRLPGHAIPLADRAALHRLWSRSTMLLPQEPRAALDPTMRAGRQLAGSHKWGGGAHVTTALAAVDLPPQIARTFPHALSGGMAQRVLVATALASDAPLIVVDEPTKGLDPALIDQVATLLRGLMSRGRILVIITHDARLARQMDGAVAVLCDGRIVECRPAPSLFAQPGHAYTQDWLTADPTAWTAQPTITRPRPSAETPPIASAKNLAFAHKGAAPLFHDLTFHLHAGEVLALSGPSGIGKSTLGDLIIGLRRPTAGRMLWQGQDLHARTALSPLRRLRRRYQKLHQDAAAAFIPHRPLARQLQDLEAIVPGLDTAAALPPLLDRLGLRPALLARYPAELSGGEAQRIALIRLLLLDPLLIVADEPTSRLDPILQRDTIRLLHGLARERGIALALISHNHALVAHIADRVLTLPTAAR